MHDDPENILVRRHSSTRGQKGVVRQATVATRTKNTYARDMGFTKIFSIYFVNISYIFCVSIRARARVSVSSSRVDDGYSGRRAANSGP